MKYRIISKAVFASVNFIITFGIAVLLPRFLGPVVYGEIGYINVSAQFILQFSSMALSTAYIYFLSNKKYGESQVNTVYSFFVICIIFLTVTMIGISIWHKRIYLILWNDISNTSYIWLGVILMILLFIQKRVIEFADCKKYTLIAEIIRFIVRLLFLSLVITLGMFNFLNIKWYYVLFIFSLLFYFGVFFWKVPFRFSRISFSKGKKLIVDMFRYLKPLIVFSIIATFYSYAGRFVLQKTSGFKQQGYYTFAFSIAMVFVGIVTSIMTIYMNKMTNLFNESKIKEARSIFLSIIFKIYSIHSFIAFFCFFYAEKIILLLVGNKFIGAVGALKWLSIFSLLHTFGLLGSRIFFSSGRTWIYGISSSIFMVLGLIWFGCIFLNSDWDLNATMLAVIMVLIYGLRVFVQLFLNMSYLKILKTKFILELILLTAVVILPLFVISYFDLEVIISAFLSLGILLSLNFIFNDYLGLKRIAYGFNKKTFI